MIDQPLTAVEREQVIRILDKWMTRCRVALWSYNEAATQANTAEKRMGVPATVFSAIVATGVFATIQSNPALGWRIATGIVALLASVLTALQTFLRPAERAEQYREAARNYGQVRRKIERAQIFLPVTRQEADKVLEELAEALTEVARGRPNVPRSIWDRANYHIRGRSDARGLRALWLRVRANLTFGMDQSVRKSRE